MLWLHEGHRIMTMINPLALAGTAERLAMNEVNRAARDLLRLRERDMTVEEKAEIEKGVYGGAEWCSAWRRTWLAVAVQCVLAGAEGHY